MNSGRLTRRLLLAGTGAAASGLALGMTAEAARAGTQAPPAGPYQPTKESLSKHPVAQWYKDAKFGIFIHWGVYAVPAFLGAAEWYLYKMNDARPGHTQTFDHHKAAYGANFNYDDFIPKFTAANYDPASWVDLFERAGAQYFVLTSKHHDGFQLFPNAASNRHSVALGPRSDLVGRLFTAAANSHLKRCLYYSLGEFYSPALGTPPRNPYTGKPAPYTGYVPTTDYVGQYEQAHLRTLIDRYDPDLLWSDGHGYHDFGAGIIFHPQVWNWRSDEILAYYYNNAVNRPAPKEVMVNDRFIASHADFKTIESDKPSYALNTNAWEACLTMGKGWGYVTGEDLTKVKSSVKLVQLLVDIVSKNGNLLLNVGPTADGVIVDWMRQRLLDMGAWLKINRKAIHGTRHWTRAEDGDLRYTTTKSAFNVISMSWPKGGTLTIPGDVPIAATSTIRILGGDGKPLPWHRSGGQIVATLPATPPPPTGGYPVVFAITPQ
jgi:alpha-L-fucosidase